MIPVTPPTPIVPSPSYWEIVRPKVKYAFEKVSADQVFGNANCKNVKLLRLYSQLYLFLTAITEERQMDASNDLMGQDYGNKYYIDKYCIKSIRKSLLCRGFDSFSVFKTFNLYNLVDENAIPITELGGGGIGIMTIRGTDPQFIIT